MSECVYEDPAVIELVKAAFDAAYLLRLHGSHTTADWLDAALAEVPIDEDEEA